MLPCKMAVYVDGGRTKVGLYPPTRQLPAELQGVPQLKRLSEEAESSLKEVLASV